MALQTNELSKFLGWYNDSYFNESLCARLVSSVLLQSNESMYYSYAPFECCSHSGLQEWNFHRMLRSLNLLHNGVNLNSHIRIRCYGST